MIARFQGHPITTTSFAFQSISTGVAGVLLLYLWAILIRRARNAYSKDTATLSVKEWTFMVYSVATLATTTVTLYSRGEIIPNTTLLENLPIY